MNIVDLRLRVSAGMPVVTVFMRRSHTDTSAGGTRPGNGENEAE